VLLPLEGLQEGTRYTSSIPGDSPEIMPLNETLNMDIHSRDKYHVALMDHLPNDDPKIFSFATPKRSPAGASTLWILKPMAPRMIQDCDKWIISLEKI
jgi:hypothetical protein